MISSEKQLIFERLNLLAQIMGGKTPTTEEAWSFWIEQVSDIPANYILMTINSWGKHSGKFPSVYDIRKSAKELMDIEDERTRQREHEDDAETIGDVVSRDPRKADLFLKFLKAHREAIGSPDEKAHLWQNIVLFNMGAISPVGRKLVQDYYGGRDPTQEEVAMAEEKYFSFSERLRKAPKARNFFGGM